MKFSRYLLLILLTGPALAETRSVEQYAKEQAILANVQLQSYVQMDPGTETAKVKSDGSTIIYQFGIPADADSEATLTALWAIQTKRAVVPKGCAALQSTGYYEKGLQFHYDYKTSHGKPLISFTLSEDSCNEYAKDNVAVCIIDSLIDTQNDTSARAAVRVCQRHYGYGLDVVPQGIARPLAAHSSGDECTVEKGSGTQSEVAVMYIRRACNKLYNANCPVSQQFGLSCN